MFTLDSITLRPFEAADFEVAYQWHIDAELEIYSGWGPRRSKEAFTREFRKFLEEPPKDLVLYAIESSNRLIGRIELALIDRTHRNAAMGLLIGDKTAWGRGAASTASRILMDYAFTVENVERVYAHVYSFNTRAQRLMRRIGMVQEGVLRKHEIHNGARRDMMVFGMLKEEFYEKYATLFPLPER